MTDAASTQGKPSIQDLFLAEATENLQTINAALLQLEQDPELLPQSIERILRNAHMLKGSTAVMGFESARQLVQNFEACAKVLEHGGLQLDAAVLAVLFAFLDAIEAVIHDVCTGSTPIEVDLAKVIEDVRAAFGRHATLIDVDLGGLTQRAAGTTHGAELGMVHVAVTKLDRQMANVEELVQLKADGHQRSDQVRDLLALLETSCQFTAKLIASTRASRRAGRTVVGNEVVLDALEHQHAIVERALGMTEDLYDHLRRHTHHLDRVGSRLQDDIRALRLVPAEQALDGLPRVARELAQQQGKQVVVELEGGDTEVDRDLLEAVKDPVLRLLRSAIDHGIESPAQRVASGKLEAGRVTVRAESRAGTLRLTVLDDGRGIDLTEVAGRGGSLDIVRERVGALGGSLAVDTVSGRGTEFHLQLPLPPPLPLHTAEHAAGAPRSS